MPLSGIAQKLALTLLPDTKSPTVETITKNLIGGARQALAPYAEKRRSEIINREWAVDPMRLKLASYDPQYYPLVQQYVNLRDRILNYQRANYGEEIKVPVLTERGRELDKIRKKWKAGMDITDRQVTMPNGDIYYIGSEDKNIIFVNQGGNTPINKHYKLEGQWDNPLVKSGEKMERPLLGGEEKDVQTLYNELRQLRRNFNKSVPGTSQLLSLYGGAGAGAMTRGFGGMPGGLSKDEERFWNANIKYFNSLDLTKLAAENEVIDPTTINSLNKFWRSTWLSINNHVKPQYYKDVQSFENNVRRNLSESLEEKNLDNIITYQDNALINDYNKLRKMSVDLNKIRETAEKKGGKYKDKYITAASKFYLLSNEVAWRASQYEKNTSDTISQMVASSVIQPSLLETGLMPDAFDKPVHNLLEYNKDFHHIIRRLLGSKVPDLPEDSREKVEDIVDELDDIPGMDMDVAFWWTKSVGSRINQIGKNLGGNMLYFLRPTSTQDYYNSMARLDTLLEKGKGNIPWDEKTLSNINNLKAIFLHLYKRSTGHSFLSSGKIPRKIDETERDSYYNKLLDISYPEKLLEVK